MKLSNGNRILAIALLLLTLVAASISCRNIVKGVGGGLFRKSTQKTIAGVVIGTVVFLAVEEVLASDMIDEFVNAPSNKPVGEAILYNNYEEALTVEISNDGSYWQEETLPVDEPLAFKSTGKGLISVHSGDQGYYMLVPGHEYSVTKRDGKIVVEEIIDDENG